MSNCNGGCCSSGCSVSTQLAPARGCSCNKTPPISSPGTLRRMDPVGPCEPACNSCCGNSDGGYYAQSSCAGYSSDDACNCCNTSDDCCAESCDPCDPGTRYERRIYEYRPMSVYKAAIKSAEPLAQPFSNSGDCCRPTCKPCNEVCQVASKPVKTTEWYF